jgi:hypothetical protein
MGTSMDIGDPWPAPDTTAKTYQQFECIVVKEGSDFYLKTYKGVVDYTWSLFPFAPGGGDLDGPGQFLHIEKQARITDWAVYQNGTRTVGTATDGPRFEWMANDGRIRLLNGDYEGGSNTWLVTISKIDWHDAAGTHASDRLIEPEVPFISVYPADDAEMVPRIQALTKSTWNLRFLYINGMSVNDGSSIPMEIGYTYKKIAQLDWNAETNSWDVNQYEYGPIDLRINFYESIRIDYGPPPDPTAWSIASASDFNSTNNYAWFESMMAIPGYTLNPSNWWYHLVNT